MFFAAEDGDALYSQQEQDQSAGADCGSEYELLTAKFRFKLNKAWKTTRSFSGFKIKSFMILQCR